MNILESLVSHRHYWGVPHKRQSDGRLIQTCYECGAEREVKSDLISCLMPENVRSMRKDGKGPRDEQFSVGGRR
ncbi:MAG: hypothetical protein AB1631_09340 [Acidobacteriota bacterium]